MSVCYSRKKKINDMTEQLKNKFDFETSMPLSQYMPKTSL